MVSGHEHTPGAGAHDLVLLETVREIERYAARAGWDQPPTLFALVETAALRAAEPDLAEHLGIDDSAGPLTPIEQPALPDRDLEDTLAGIRWPEEVTGAALVVERLVLPPSAEDDLPSDDPDVWAEEARTHADRQDVRLVAAVLRDGRRECAVRLRAHDSEDQVLTGPDLVPGLTDALLHTLA